MTDDNLFGFGAFLKNFFIAFVMIGSLLSYSLLTFSSKTVCCGCVRAQFKYGNTIWLHTCGIIISSRGCMVAPPPTPLTPTPEKNDIWCLVRTIANVDVHGSTTDQFKDVAGITDKAKILSYVG